MLVRLMVMMVIWMVSRGEDPVSYIKIGDLISMSVKSESQVTALLLILEPIDGEVNISQMINLTCPSQGDQRVDNITEAPVKTANFRNCLEVQEKGFNVSGEYAIHPYLCCPDRVVTVYCDLDSDGGGWTVIQRRGDYPQQEDFFRSWKEYEEGFGKLTRDFWLGLSHVHALTGQEPHEVRFDLEDFDGVTGWAKYGQFSVSGEDYELSIGVYSGDVGDGMRFHDAMSFSTRDKDNDNSTENCAEQWIGGWWYKNCQHVSLNGPYVGPTRGPGEEAIVWYPWRYFSPLKRTEMKVRPSGDAH